MNTFMFRFTPSLSSDEFEKLINEKLPLTDYAEVVLVREMGEHGDNLHYHGRLSSSKDARSVRNWCNYHLSLKGNQQLSVTVFDPHKAQDYHRYMAKGPITRRLSMPVVIIDQLGLLWETLHHAYHDQAVIADSKSRKRGRDGVVKPPTFLQELIAMCRADAVSTKRGIFDKLVVLLHRRPTVHDAFWVEKMVWGVYAVVNPDSHQEDLFAVVNARMNFS